MRSFSSVASRLLVPLTAMGLLLAACGGETKSVGDDTNDAGVAGQAGTGGAGGSAAQAGTGGAGGGQAGTGGSAGSSTVAETDKVDLLFMIDNSASMADKQQILASSVPSLVQQLANPPCETFNGAFASQPASADEACPTGSQRARKPVKDIHIGIISSSLGGGGSDSCSISGPGYPNDHAHLLHRTTEGANIPTYQGKGFLNWDPAGADSPAGESDVKTLISTFAEMVHGVDQVGCGFEASLESWYRFLVDPAPYLNVVPAPCNSSDTNKRCRAGEGIDDGLLQERADFLRPDSLVAIVMLTDENDCSVKVGGQNYLAMQQLDGTGTFHLPRATKECATDPNSPDCNSCGFVDAKDHPECAHGWDDPEKDDAINLRCFHQKQRFGLDFLYPVQRYIDGLTKPVLADGHVNPLLCGEPSSDGMSCVGKKRGEGLVILQGIVGVPWQDIAQDPSSIDKGYKTAQQVDWSLILGDPDHLVDPKDPLMVESIDARTGVNPPTGQALGQATASNGVVNEVNGAERKIERRNDLQYACVFKLPSPTDCAASGASWGCDCQIGDGNPLCWDGQSYGTKQYRAKAYPGTRQLQVLKGVGDGGVVSSICALNTTDDGRKDFGYRPAFQALMQRMDWNLTSK